MLMLPKSWCNALIALTFGATVLHAWAQASAEPAVFGIRSLYGEYLVGEVIVIQVRVFNPAVNSAISAVKLSAAHMYPGSFETELIDPSGKTFGFTRPPVREQPQIFKEHRIEIAPGAVWEDTQSAWQLAQMAGLHRLRATYRPNWKGLPEITRAIDINVLAPERAILESKRSAPGFEGKDVDILKVRTADGFWLYYRNSPNAGLSRLVQINESTTYSVSARQDHDGYPGGICVITYQLDGEQRLLKLDYRYGSPLPGQLSSNDAVTAGRK